MQQIIQLLKPSAACQITTLSPTLSLSPSLSLSLFLPLTFPPRRCRVSFSQRRNEWLLKSLHQFVACGFFCFVFFFFYKLKSLCITVSFRVIIVNKKSNSSHESHFLDKLKLDFKLWRGGKKKRKKLIESYKKIKKNKWDFWP